MKLVPQEARLMMLKSNVLVILGGFFIFGALVSVTIARIGFKTIKANQFPYPGKFCLFDTVELEGGAAVKKGKQYVTAGAICFLAILAIIYSTKVIFHFDQVFGGK
jgi:hypothetical protein